MGHQKQTHSRVGLRCDAIARTGVGHFIRAMALSDELHARGIEPVLLGAVEVPWLTGQLERRPWLRRQEAPAEPGALASLAAALGLSAVVLDGYDLDRGCGSALRRSGLRVASILDGPYGVGQDADVYVDNNLGAEPTEHQAPGATMLCGLGYTLFRDEVLAHRPVDASPRPAPGPGEPLRVLGVFGGTDPYAAAPVVLPLLLQAGVGSDQAVAATVVAATPERAAQLTAVPVPAGMSVEVVPPLADLAAVAAASDAVVSAAGTTTWELLCLGAPTGLVAVTDNQEVGYQQVLAEQVVAPVGRLPQLTDPGDSGDAARAESVRCLSALVGDAGERARLRREGMTRVDGLGRARVLDALLG